VRRWRVRRRPVDERRPVCPHCGSDLDAGGICARCGGVSEQAAATGWRPDPTARYEGRYYTAERPTNRVRNGKKEATDPVGGQLLPGYVEVPTARWSLRSTWLATGGATAVIVMLLAVIGILLSTRPPSAPSPEARYLTALKDAGQFKEFNSDVNAVAHGRQVCRQLDGGAPQQGVMADKFAVEAFCPQFAEGFHILDTVTASGVFVLIDSSGIDAIAVDGPACDGTGGYSDIAPTTPVVVKNGKGDVLATTSLGPGKGDAGQCTFSFEFPVTEGQDRYVVSVGRRGEFSYTFGQLRGQGVHIRLGH
jgi:hypothetical protein